MSGGPATGAHFGRPAVDGPPARIDRHRLVFALGATLAALPLLVLDNLPANAEASEESDVRVAATADSGAEEPAEPSSSSSSTVPAADTTVVTTAAAPPTTSEEPTTSTTEHEPDPVPEPEPEVVALVAPSPTAPPATTQPASTERGEATWYEQPAGYGPNGCAHKSIPFGTTVTVTNTANGRSATCQVNDRGPFGGGRIIDLDDGVYSRLAPLSTGVITVTISW
jgi:rare lipoprotein A